MIAGAWLSSLMLQMIDNQSCVGKFKKRMLMKLKKLAKAAVLCVVIDSF